MSNLFWISHLDDYKARSIHRMFKRACESMWVCCCLNMPWCKHTGVLNKWTTKKKWYDNHEFSKDNVWMEEVVVAAARTCRPNMSLKYFHFAQFYGFKKWKIPHAHYQCMCTKCLFCIAKKHTHAQIHAHTSFSAHLVNLSRIWTIFL